MLLFFPVGGAKRELVRRYIASIRMRCALYICTLHVDVFCLVPRKSTNERWENAGTEHRCVICTSRARFFFLYFRPKKLDHVGVAVVGASRSTKAAKGRPSDPDPTLYGERGGLIERHGVVNVKKLFLFPFLGGDHRS